MSYISHIVVDDFYENPDDVRDLAISLDFTKRQNATYPGQEAIAQNYNWLPVIKKIQSFIPSEQIKETGFPIYPQGKFHLSNKNDIKSRPVGVHVDIAKWSAVIYLSKDPDPRAGTTWYMHIPTKQFTDTDIFLNYCSAGLINHSSESIKKEIHRISTDMNQWREIQRISMVYNRLLLFKADTFHATNCFFGSDKLTGRLTQHFILYSYICAFFR